MEPLITTIDLLVDLYLIVLLARIVLPLFGVSPYHPAMRLIFRLTEPVLAPIRTVMPRAGMLDFSPMVAVILLTVLRSILAALVAG